MVGGCHNTFIIDENTTISRLVGCVEKTEPTIHFQLMYLSKLCESDRVCTDDSCFHLPFTITASVA
jgi:hypothetical protein